MDAIKVLIVDDHPVVRRGINSLLSNHDDLCVVGEADSVAAALACVEQLVPDVVLLDIRLPGESGLDLLDKLRTQVTKVLVLTSFDDEEHVLVALRGGASGYILKNASDEMLCEAIRAVHQGGRVLSSQVTEQMVHQLSADPDKVMVEMGALTQQDLRFLHLLVEGASNEQMATELFMSVASVKRKLRHIFTRLGVQNRAQAAAAIVQRHLI
jgi:DNA-binding NarL/FixJ family response regulator